MNKNVFNLNSKIWLSPPHMSGHEQEFIDDELPAGAYVAFDFDIFNSNNYREWKREHRAKLQKKNLQQTKELE